MTLLDSFISGLVWVFGGTFGFILAIASIVYVEDRITRWIDRRRIQRSVDKALFDD